MGHLLPFHRHYISIVPSSYEIIKVILPIYSSHSGAVWCCDLGTPMHLAGTHMVPVFRCLFSPRLAETVLNLGYFK